MIIFDWDIKLFFKTSVKVTMKSILVVSILFLLSNTLFGQQINGQWRGYFDSKGDIVQSSADNIEYVLEIEINGTQITGYSYSYFQNRKFYVICSLTGIYYQTTKSMKVTETARIKGSTPPNWSDCLQTHILTYEKEGDKEELSGKWVPAPGQTGGCGSGKTTLARRTVSRDLSSYNKSTTSSPFSTQKPAVNQTNSTANNKKVTIPPVAKNTPNLKATKTPVPDVVSSKPVDRDTPEIITQNTKRQAVPILAPDRNFEKRSNEIIKTIEIGQSNFKVDLYDNGDIDGDSVSLFYNGKLLLSQKRLSDKPISLTLEVSPDKDMNELTMYAENLGTIPPNTALMIVSDGEKRYEVRISSDLKKSGTIRFVKR